MKDFQSEIITRTAKELFRKRIENILISGKIKEVYLLTVVVVTRGLHFIVVNKKGLRGQYMR